VQEPNSLRIVHPPAEEPAARRPGKAMSAADKRELFKSLVVHSLDAGFLRYSRRQELLRVAAQLGLSEFEACLLIAEAQFHSDQIDPATAGEMGGYDIAPVARGLSLSTQVLSALIAAALIDAIILLWIL